MERGPFSYPLEALILELDPQSGCPSLPIYIISSGRWAAPPPSGAPGLSSTEPAKPRVGQVSLHLGADLNFSRRPLVGEGRSCRFVFSAFHR